MDILRNSEHTTPWCDKTSKTNSPVSFSFYNVFFCVNPNINLSGGVVKCILVIVNIIVLWLWLFRRDCQLLDASGGQEGFHLWVLRLELWWAVEGGEVMIMTMVMRMKRITMNLPMFWNPGLCIFDPFQLEIYRWHSGSRQKPKKCLDRSKITSDKS